MTPSQCFEVNTIYVVSGILVLVDYESALTFFTKPIFVDCFFLPVPKLTFTKSNEISLETQLKPTYLKSFHLFHYTGFL